MSQVTMTLIDRDRTIHSTPHGSLINPIVAALSAEPETIDELGRALRRFLPPDRMPAFADWARGLCDEPYDAGLCIIDVAARLIISTNTYSSVMLKGQTLLEGDGQSESDVWLPYHLPPDWELKADLEGWHALAEERRKARAERPPLDARQVLYGQVAEFVAMQCFDARQGLGSDGTLSAPAGWWRELPERAAEGRTPTGNDAIAEIHARWLMIPRDDLRGRSPRETLLERESFLAWDLQDRQFQWSMLGQQPPPLDRESAAFRFAGFGPHENVIYYDLVRYLVEECWRRVVEPGTVPDATVESEAAYLGRVKDGWLNTTHESEYLGRSPADLITFERLRVPVIMSPEQAIVDDDCPLCRLAEDWMGPAFWHLDGCNQDEEFPFSLCGTREEWEAEERQREEFSRKFDEEWKAREAAGEAEGDAHGESCSPWQPSFPGPHAAPSPTFALFWIGACLGEIITELKRAQCPQTLIDKLNRDFDNLCRVAKDSTDALLNPVVEHFCITLREVAESRPGLSARCQDLERQLNDLSRRVEDEDQTPPEWDEGEEDVPF